jgi:hypothetical protein
MDDQKQQPKHKQPTKPQDPKQQEEPPQGDTDLRNQIAGIALREIIGWLLSSGRASEESLAASWAFRYADRFVEASKIPPRQAPTMVRGRQDAVFQDGPGPEFPIAPEPVPPMAEDALAVLGQTPTPEG